MSGDAFAYAYSGKAVRIVDGDSLYVRLLLTVDYPHVHIVRYLEPVYLRLAGVDCPETGDPGGPEATEYVRTLLPEGTAVTVLTDDAEDSFGRLLADVALPSGGMLTEALLGAGHATIYQD